MKLRRVSRGRDIGGGPAPGEVHRADIDRRSRDHAVTRLAEECGWRLDSEYGGPGRCVYVGPNGQWVAAFLTFDGEAEAGERAIYYAMVSDDGGPAHGIAINQLPLADQMTMLREYFTSGEIGTTRKEFG